MTIEKGRTRLLIVEGRHEVLFFEALCRARSITTEPLQVLPIGGKTQRYENLEALALDPLFREVVTMAIVRDADFLPSDDPSRDRSPRQIAAELALSAVQGCLRSARLPVPHAHGEFVDGPFRIGVFITPNGVDDGMLESLCVQSIAGIPSYACVTAYFDCLAEQGVTPGNVPKAHAHAFIASCANPDVHVGIAAREGYWDLHHPAFDSLAAFVAAILE